MKQTIAAALEARGYDTLTPVQEAVTAPETVGRDMLVSAQTGSGKTLGFTLAIAPTLLGEDDTFGYADGPLALVIAPTRELALQVRREMTWIYAEAGARMASAVGGMDVRDERRALSRGAHVVVATPGRLRDHITREAIDLSKVRAVVLDEADEMLDLGFREDLEFILDACPAARQTLLFSATVPDGIARLAKGYQRDALRIETASKAEQHADISYRAMVVGERDVEAAVVNTLRLYDAPSAIVFANTRATVARLTARLTNRNLRVVALSGELTQSERTNALQAVRDGRARICIATDVAARGIDLPRLDLVIHAELPSSHETLLHRSGRTGRAGRKGTSALVVTPKTRRKAERLLREARLDAEWGSAPSAEAVLEEDQKRLMALIDEAAESENPMVDELAERFDARTLAATALSLYRAAHAAPEDIAPVSDAPKRKGPFGPSVWFALPGGRDVGADPRRVLPRVCKAGGLTREDVGAIRIGDDRTVFELAEAKVDGFLAMVSEGGVEGTPVSRLDGIPDEASRPAPRGGPRPGRSGGHRKGPRDDKPFDRKSPRRPREDGPRDDRPPRLEDRPKPARRDEPAGAKSERPARGADDRKESWKDRPGKPSRDAKSFKPHTGPKDGDTRPKKPKPGPKPSPAPRAKASDTSVRWKKDGPAKGPGKRQAAGGDAMPKRPGGKPGAKKGPPPPKGKPNSKKNKARRAEGRGPGS